jgi:hypothetical protein
MHSEPLKPADDERDLPDDRRVQDFGRFHAAIEWIRLEVEQPAGFVSLRVFRDRINPARITLLEEWTDVEALFTSLRDQGRTAGPDFVARAGVRVEDFESALWTSTLVAAIEPSGPGAAP